MIGIKQELVLLIHHINAHNRLFKIKLIEIITCVFFAVCRLCVYVCVFLNGSPYTKTLFHTEALSVISQK